ncbi:TetR/AcrR family transcriptional regulator [Phytoactinopolyspora halotolerans]|uniref:TetR/AcrR family transcriptional regulator n=1 Tax=Phytoactinopolyspora halotolerans TaxID=1981512 RepID=A0A6L9S3S7_9ACTN|nr:TetR/AcrR family transcriptional regulator [Phytoactinopolyspora halotolerans]NED99313.1 TetR/AcrR family transcriptional regulator [Phytoactinopolyspora halotolerans]
MDTSQTGPGASEPPDVASEARPSRRERARAATIEEIKETALRLMHEQGRTDLRFSDIAREMGMTAPALYRYFNDRDELLTAMIVDAYDDLGDKVADAREAVDPEDLPGRFYAVAAAYRAWANRDPQRFALIFGLPVPGYIAPEEGPTTEAAQRAMMQLKAMFLDADQRGMLGSPIIAQAHPSLHKPAKDEDEVMTPAGAGPLPPEFFQACLTAWSMLHGFVTLETYGHFSFIGPEGRDALFDTVVRLTAITSGYPWPDS